MIILSLCFPYLNMVKKNEFDSNTESLRNKSTTIRRGLSNIKKSKENQKILQKRIKKLGLSFKVKLKHQKRINIAILMI